MTITTQPSGYIFAKTPTFIYFDKAGADYVVAKLVIDGVELPAFLLNGDRVQINKKLKSYLSNKISFVDGKNVNAVSEVFVSFTPYTNNVAGTTINSNTLKAILSTTIDSISDYENLKPIGELGSVVPNQYFYLSFLKLDSVASITLKVQVVDKQGVLSAYANIETHTSNKNEIVSFETSISAIATAIGIDENTIASINYMANDSTHKGILQVSAKTVIELTEVRFLNNFSAVQSLAITGERENGLTPNNTEYTYEKDGYNYSDVVAEDFQSNIKINSGYMSIAQLTQFNTMLASEHKQVKENNLWVYFYVAKPTLEYGATNEFVNNRDVVLTLKRYSKDAN